MVIAAGSIPKAGAAIIDACRSPYHSVTFLFRAGAIAVPLQRTRSLRLATATALSRASASQHLDLTLNMIRSKLYLHDEHHSKRLARAVDKMIVGKGELVARTSVVNVDGARVAYRLHGQGPAVVLVNGTAALDVHWGPVIAELGKQRTVISLDYSGSGDTTDDGSALCLQKLARQVREVAGAAGVDRFDLVGHSLGAAIAIELAATSPDLVRSLIVVAGFSWGAEPRLSLQFELWLDLLRTNRDAFLRLLLLSGLTPTFVSTLGTSAIEDMIKAYMPLANWEGIARQVELDLAVDIRRQASSVTSPTLVINCAHDQIVTQTSELAARIPGSTCRQISAGHLAYFEGAEEFLSLAAEFLGRHGV